MSIQDLGSLILSLPRKYEAWWLKLLHDSPLHVLIETTLILFIIWLLFIRRTVDPKKTDQSPKLSKKEIDWLLQSWQPEPLVPKPTAREQAVYDSNIVIDAIKPSNYLQIRGIDTPVLAASHFDFFNLGSHPDVKASVTDALNYYGCGSCGPRGFYGTIDKHLTLEDRIAKFLGAEEAICYSDGASAVYSVIPAYAKKEDLIVVDEACSEMIKTGVYLSRATVRTFRHNDMEDLANLLEAIAKEDIQLKRDALQQRRFIVAEGIYRNTGDILPLPELMEIKEKFCYRLILDETLSFGVLGKTGKGVTEHFGIDRKRVEIMTFSLDTALASVGGICVGDRQIVDHQRLSGSGYCYSASSAPFLCSAAITALDQIEQNPSLISNLSNVTSKLYSSLTKIPGLKVISETATPIIHLALEKTTGNNDEDVLIIQSIANECVKNGVGVVTSKYSMLVTPSNAPSNGINHPLTPSNPVSVPYTDIRPSIMVTSNIDLDDKKINSIVNGLTMATKKFIKI